MGRRGYRPGISGRLVRSVNLALAGAAAVLGAGTAPSAWPHPDGVPFYDWLMTRQRPDVGGPCCGAGPGTDQYFSDRYEEAENGSYRVWVEGFGEPALVPANKVIPEDVNPTGRGVIWMSIYWPAPPGPPEPGIVYCFEPGAGT